MATRLEDEFDPTRINAPDAAYPAGSLKDETTPGVSDDGTPLASRVGNDWQGFSQSALNKAGISANGQPDSVSNPQILQAIEQMYNDGDSQLAGGNIWPLSSQESASVGDDLTGYKFVRFTGGILADVTLCALIDSTGTNEFPSGIMTEQDLTYNPLPQVTIGGVRWWVATEIEHYSEDYVSVNMFGAGGGVSSGVDDPCFQAACGEVERRGGGILKANDRDYIYGWQNPNPSPSVGERYWQLYTDGKYANGNIIDIRNIDGLEIDFTGSTATLKDNFRYGSFDPLTGNVYNPPAGDFNDFSYAANCGSVISLEDCSNVIINNPIFNGNMDNLVQGGRFGDTGIQLIQDGIGLYRCTNVEVNNPQCIDQGRDGWYVTGNSFVQMNIEFKNGKSIRSGRQGISWVGGDDLKLTHCQLLDTGNGPVSSAPRAGLDIEDNSQGCYNGTFEDCTFANNNGADILVLKRSSNNLFRNCKIVSNTRGIWYLPDTDRYNLSTSATFVDCLISANIIYAYNCTFRGCTITDDNIDGYRPNPDLKTWEYDGYAKIESCDLVQTRYENDLFFVNGDLEIYRSRYIVKGDSYPAQQRLSVMRPGKIENLTVTDELTNSDDLIPDGDHAFLDGVGLDLSQVENYIFDTDKISVLRTEPTNYRLGIVRNAAVENVINVIGDNATDIRIPLPFGNWMVTVSSSYTRATVISNALNSSSAAARQDINVITKVTSELGTGDIVGIVRDSSVSGFNSIQITSDAIDLTGLNFRVSLISLDSLQPRLNNKQFGVYNLPLPGGWPVEEKYVIY